MPTQIQLRRGNTAQTSAFTGALAEITIDTDKKVVVVHDGVTAGGNPLALDSKAQAAFNAANAAGSSATVTAAFDQANSAYNQANTATNNAASASLYANTGITLAQSAYDQSNVANTIANTAVQRAGDTMTGALSIQDSTSSNSITTGALIVLGGVGVSGNLYANLIWSENYTGTLDGGNF
jgi:hypothetical protein